MKALQPARSMRMWLLHFRLVVAHLQTATLAVPRNSFVRILVAHLLRVDLSTLPAQNGLEDR
jgi:hypothetical protein